MDSFEINFMRIALGIQGLGLSDKNLTKIVRTYELIKEKGDTVSIMDIAKMESEVDEMFTNSNTKTFSDKPVRMKAKTFPVNINIGDNQINYESLKKDILVKEVLNRNIDGASKKKLSKMTRKELIHILEEDDNQIH